MFTYFLILLPGTLKRKTPVEFDSDHDTTKDADGDIDPEYLDPKPRASTASKAPPVLPEKTVDKPLPLRSQRARARSPTRETSPIPRGAAIGEHALPGPSHPDTLSLRDAPVAPTVPDISPFSS